MGTLNFSSSFRYQRLNMKKTILHLWRLENQVVAQGWWWYVLTVPVCPTGHPTTASIDISSVCTLTVHLLLHIYYCTRVHTTTEQFLIFMYIKILHHKHDILWKFLTDFCCTMLSSCRCRIRTLIQSISSISFFSIYIHLYPHKTAYRHGKNVPLHF